MTVKQMCIRDRMIQDLADVAKKTVRQNTNFDFKILGVYEYSDFYGHNLGTEVRIKLYNRNISEIVNIQMCIRDR